MDRPGGKANEDDRRQGLPDLPWSFMFDPIANARALSDVQRRGLEASRKLVDRMLSSIEPREHASNGAGDLRPSDGFGPPGAPGPSAPWASLQVISEGWIEFLARTMSVMARLPGTNGSHGTDGVGHTPAAEACLDVDDSAGAAITLNITVDGEAQPVELWMRNLGPNPVGPIRVHAGELRSSDGRVLPSGTVTFQPDTVELPPRSTRGVTVSIGDCTDVATETYRGIIQVAGVPRVSAVLEVTVVGRDDG